MSFSHPEFAKFVQDRFEPTWESVRDVPRISIDFGGVGGARRLERTLHGNIATFVVLPDGLVADVIPGLYDRETFRARLTASADMAERIARLSPELRVDAVRNHHKAELARLTAPAATITADVRKRVVERPVERAVSTDTPEVPLTPEALAARAARLRILMRSVSKSGIEDLIQPIEPLDMTRTDSKFRIEKPVEAALPRLNPLHPAPDLTRDTENNEKNRRPAVHRLLAGYSPFTVSGLSGQVYAEILGTDLTDPYLGLGAALFDTYPFER